MEEKLPEGWVETTLGDICTIIMGQSPPFSEYNEDGEGLPFFQGKAEFTDLYPQVKKWCVSPIKIAEANDILLSVRAPVGPTNIALSQCCIGRGLAAIRPECSIYFRYILYMIRNFNASLTRVATGTTFEAISGDDIRAFRLPLAPLLEQSRIVAAIEQQFTRLDNAVASLQSAKRRVKQYRASLLKAAVEGELTKEWRVEYPTSETGAQLLARILAERRVRWEEEQLRRMREKGITPKDNKWKLAYKEPQVPDVGNLPTLPDGWCWATFEQVSQRVTVGYVGSMAHEYINAGIPFLRSQNVRSNRFDPNGLKFISEEFHRKIEKSALKPGDILVVRSGSVGVACVMPDLYEEANCSDLVIVKQPAISPYYAAYYMNSTA